jgi:hypothetical protein
MGGGLSVTPPLAASCTQCALAEPTSAAVRQSVRHSGSFAEFFGETPSTKSGTEPGKLVEREGLEPSTPAL